MLQKVCAHLRKSEEVLAVLVAGALEVAVSISIIVVVAVTVARLSGVSIKICPFRIPKKFSHILYPG